MNRIERTSFNEYESLCQFSEQPDLEENMVQEVSMAGVAIAWGVCIFALLWLLTALLRAGLRFEHWKWMVAR